MVRSISKRSREETPSEEDDGIMSFLLSPIHEKLHSTSPCTHSRKREMSTSFSYSQTCHEEVSSLECRESLGTCEMALLQRPQEELADMCLFLAKTFSQLKSSSALEAFVSYVNQKGCEACVDALQVCGTEEDVLDHLFHGCMHDDHAKVPVPLVVRVIFWLLHRVSVRVLSRRESAQFFVFLLRSPTISFKAVPHTSNHTDTPTVSSSSSSSVRHWSNVTRKKPENTAEATRVSSSLETAVTMLCGAWEVEMNERRIPDTPTEMSGIGPWILEQLSFFLLRQNQESNGGCTIGSLHASLANENGVEILCHTLLACSRDTPSLSSFFPWIKSVLTVLELLTVSEALKTHTVQLSFCVEALSSLFAVLSSSVVRECGEKGKQKAENKGNVVDMVPTNDEAFPTMSSPGPSSDEGGGHSSPGEDRYTIQLRAIRVLTNVTAVDPYPVGEPSGIHLIQYLKFILLFPLPHEMEILPFALCCTINMAKRECLPSSYSRFSSPLPSFTSAFFHSGSIVGIEKKARHDSPYSEVGSVLDVLVEKLFYFYTHINAVEYVVIGGYYALLTCILSLLQYAGESLRIPVMTALVHHYKTFIHSHSIQNTFNEKKASTPSMSLKSLEQPMTIAVVIVQEFLDFQSRTGTLCENAFIEITEILDCVIAANKILVSPSIDMEKHEQIFHK